MEKEFFIRQKYIFTAEIVRPRKQNRQCSGAFCGANQY